jgi:hypothetical protein
MEWETKQSELERLNKFNHGKTFRKIRRFLFLPKNINGIKKWLCFGYIKQELKIKTHGVEGYYLGLYWKDSEWTDESDYSIINAEAKNE